MRTSDYLEAAVEAAARAGLLIAGRMGDIGNVAEMSANDIKLEIDFESQDLITRILLERFPGHGILGEEGTAGNAESEYQWIVDPIDGTVNYYYGIPHFGISVALRHRDRIIAGVIHDPVVGELWTAGEGTASFLNGRKVTASKRDKLSEAVVSLGFAKQSSALQQSMRRFEIIAPAVRKVRMLGSAALEMAYVASGRLDAYIEAQVSIWDIAAGILLVELAGGKVVLKPYEDQPDTFSIICTNGLVPIEELLEKQGL